MEPKRPDVKLRDVIYFGNSIDPKKALVSRIYDSESPADRVEAVYLDHKNMAIAEDFRWTGERWELVNPNLSGAYAENSDRLRSYARALLTEQKQRKTRRRR